MQAKCSCTEETGQAKETWDEVLVYDRKKLGMDSADPRIVLSGEDVLKKNLYNKLNLQ